MTQSRGDGVDGRSGTGADAVGGYRPALDGVRALAVAAVVAYHAQLPGADGGFLGVSLFFTLSGYLITAILLREQEQHGRIDLRRFWVRRIRRLVPAALLGIAVALVFGATVATRGQLDGLPGEVLAGAFYVANWLFISTDQSYAELFSSPSPLQHYWSLAIEEQFYVVLPLLIIGVFAVRRSVRLLFAVFVVVAIASTAWMWIADNGGASLDRLYYGTDTRGAELAVGAALAAGLHLVGLERLRRLQRPLVVIGPVVLAALIWSWSSQSLDSGSLFRGGFALHAVGSAIVIVAILADAGPLTKVLGAAPLAYIGRISYGIYLFHWPVFLWLTEERTGLSQWPLFAVRAAVAVGVAAASYTLVEQPIRRGQTPGVKGIAGMALVPGLALALFGVSLVVAERDAVDEAATIRVADNSLGIPVAAEDGVLDIVAIAGSSATANLDELAARVEPEPTVVLRATQTLVCRDIERGVEDLSCPEWSDDWAELVADEPDVVLFHVGDWSDDIAATAPTVDEAVALLDRGLDVLTANDATVVWVPTPASAEERFARAGSTFEQAMKILVSSRLDTAGVSYDRLVPPEDPEVVDIVATTLLEEAALYQRSDRAGLPRVLVVGDSQARSVGFGLAQWGEREQQAWVWNRGAPGCPFALDGTVRFLGEAPVGPDCREAVASFDAAIESFQPDVVIALTGVWDLVPRRLEGWDNFRTLGDPDFDAYLLGELQSVHERLAAGGADVVWMSAPCVGSGASLRADVIARQTAIRRQFNDTVLPDVVTQPGARFFDLDAALCPDGDALDEVDGVGTLRYDGLHFTVPGAYWFAETYGPALIGRAAE